MNARVIGIAALLAAATVVGKGSAAEPAIECGSVITSHVTLTENLACDGNGLVIEGGDVSVDLAGHSIIGSGSGTGLRISRTCSTGDAPTSITVYGGTVTGFTTGVHMTTEPGEELFSSCVVDLDVKSMLVAGNTVGVVAVEGFWVRGITRVSGSTISRNASNGIEAAHYRPLHVVDNAITHNGGQGVQSFSQDSYDLIEENFVAHNAGHGVSLEDTVARIADNRLLHNGGTGLLVQESFCDSSGYSIDDNVADKNGDGGIRFVFTTPLEFCEDGHVPPGNANNAAKGNAGFECIVVTCAKNRGQAKRTADPSTAALPVHSSSGG